MGLVVVELSRVSRPEGADSSHSHARRSPVNVGFRVRSLLSPSGLHGSTAGDAESSLEIRQRDVLVDPCVRTAAVGDLGLRRALRR